MLDRLGWLALLLSLIPAALRLRRTRSLLRHVDDPALPERLVGSRNLIAFAFSAVATLEIILWTRHAVWSIPLLIVTFALAGWPLRRALFAETWSFPAYLWFYARLIFAIYGFWLALTWSVFIPDLDGRRAWTVAAVIGTVLLIWNEQYGRFIRFVLQTRPVVTPSLVDRFNAIIAQTSVAPPMVEYVDTRGGAFVNAIALPHTTRPSVLFTSTLLERFDEDEITAIFAHEVAHLEHYNPAYLRRLRWIGWLMIVATVTIGPLVHAVAPAYDTLVGFWPFVLLIWMILRGSHKQKHETESDLRSAALTGDPEGMVRALIKLHEMMKLPRRLDPSHEVNASHPSLARRIQALRASSGSVAAALTESIDFRHGSTSVTLHADRLTWSEGDVTSYTLAYSALDELRIEADGKGAMRFVASDPAGRRWAMPLASEDVARAQAALNVVDAQLRPTPTGAAKWVVFGRIAAALCAVAALGAMQLASLAVAAVAALSFERPLVRAAGVAGLAGGLFSLRNSTAPSFGWILILSAVQLLFIAYRDKRDIVPSTTWPLVALIGVFAVVCATPLAISQDLLALHQSARHWTGVTVLALAFAAAAWPRSRVWRAAAGVAVVGGLAAAALGSTRALDAMLDDPFLATASTAPPASLIEAPAAEFAIDVIPSELVISPNAEAIAASHWDERQHWTFFVGKPGAELTEIAADSAAFVDDQRLLVLEETNPRTAPNTTIRLVSVDQPSVAIWERSLALDSASLAVDRDGTAWQVLGLDRSGFVRAGGDMNGNVQTHSWPLEGSSEEDERTPIASAGSSLLMYTRTPTEGTTLPGLGEYLPFLQEWRTESRFFVLDESGVREILRTPLEVQCEPNPIIGDEPICSAYDASRTHLAAMSPQDGSLRILARFPHAMHFSAHRGWAAGWWRTPFALNMDRGEMIAVEYDRAKGPPIPLLMSAAGETIAMIWTDRSRPQGSTLRIYRGVLASPAIR